MTIPTLVLGATTLLFFAMWFGRFLANRAHADREVFEATREYRIALAYVASGKAYPYEALFGNAVIHGHPAAITRQFPDYPSFRAAELDRDEALEIEC